MATDVLHSDYTKEIGQMLCRQRTLSDAVSVTGYAALLAFFVKSGVRVSRLPLFIFWPSLLINLRAPQGLLSYISSNLILSHLSRLQHGQILVGTGLRMHPRIGRAPVRMHRIY